MEVVGFGSRFFDHHYTSILLNQEYLDNFQDLFKYTIYHTVCDKHATSILFRINNNIMYIECFNREQSIKQDLKHKDFDQYLPQKAI